MFLYIYPSHLWIEEVGQQSVIFSRAHAFLKCPSAEHKRLDRVQKSGPNEDLSKGFVKCSDRSWSAERHRQQVQKETCRCKTRFQEMYLLTQCAGNAINPSNTSFFRKTQFQLPSKMRFGLTLLTLLVAGCEVMAKPLDPPRNGLCNHGQLACCDGTSNAGQFDSMNCQGVDSSGECFATLACCPSSEVNNRLTCGGSNGSYSWPCNRESLSRTRSAIPILKLMQWPVR